MSTCTASSGSSCVYVCVLTILPPMSSESMGALQAARSSSSSRVGRLGRCQLVDQIERCLILVAARRSLRASPFPVVSSRRRLLRAYLLRQSADFHPGMVHLLGPFVHVYSQGEHGGAAEPNAYHCFHELMKRLRRGLTFEGSKQMVVTFMTLLRHTLPELYSYLEEEQCAGGEWLNSWLQLLLSKELPLPCLLRLWDSCFN